MILWKLNLKNEKIGLYEMKRDGDIRNIWNFNSKL
jgi:hypothetical protein